MSIGLTKILFHPDVQILLKSNDEKSQAHAYFSPPASSGTFRAKKIFSFFSTSSPLPIPQNLACTAVSLNSLWKQVLEVGRKLVVQPQTQCENALLGLANLHFIPARDKEASDLQGTSSSFGPAWPLREIKGSNSDVMMYLELLLASTWCLGASERITQASLALDNPSFLWSQLLCPP